MLNLKKLVAWLSGTSDEVVKEQTGGEERRRFQRLHLENCRLHIENEGPFPVTNLSYGGFRVDLTDWSSLSSLTGGQTIEINLHMQQMQLDCKVEVKNLFGNLAGCAYCELTPAQSRIVSEFIKPRVLGLSLREIDAARLQNDDPQLRMRWFQGEDGVQVFLWQTLAGDTVKQEFYFFDYYMGWQSDATSLQTGKVRAESRSGFGRISPDAVIFYRIPPYRALKLGRVILECSKLPDEARENMLREIAVEEKRLFHRFIVKDGGVVFVAEKLSETSFPVLNISMQGMALLKPADLNMSCENDLIGAIHDGKTSINVAFKPAYTHDNILGGLFRALTNEEQLKLEQFLAPRLLAQYLEEVPSPPELPAFASASSRAYLYTGLHNTHILSLITSDGQISHGRIAFMDRAIICKRNSIVEVHCPDGLIFPADWELDTSLAVSKVGEVTRKICYEMVLNAELASEVKESWLKILGAEP